MNHLQVKKSTSSAGQDSEGGLLTHPSDEGIALVRVGVRRGGQKV